MQELYQKIMKSLKANQSARRKLTAVVVACSLVVVGGVFWALKLTGIAITDDLTCTLEEHIHTEACTEAILICTEKEATAESTNSDPSEGGEEDLLLAELTVETEPTEELEPTQASEQAETAEGHVHTQACYEYRYICEKTEHTHTDACYGGETATASESGDTKDLAMEPTQDEKLASLAGEMLLGAAPSMRSASPETVKLEMGSIIDGTMPFDADNSEGNDASDSNKIVRTFDTVTYLVEYTVSDALAESGGTIKIEATLSRTAADDTPKSCSLREAKFRLDQMSWLESASQTAAGEQVILTGEYTLPAGSESSGELPFTVEVMGMANTEKLTAAFSAWEPDENGAKPEGVTMLSAEAVAVSAKYGVAFRLKFNENGFNMSQVENTLGTYDFSTGNGTMKEELIQNIYGTTQIDGRMLGVSVVLELLGDSEEKGIKGIEIPTGEITGNYRHGYWKYSPDTSAREDLYGCKYNDGKWYPIRTTPLLWDWTTGTEATGELGRDMTVNNGALSIAGSEGPRNTFDPDAPESSCLNGGQWEVSIPTRTWPEGNDQGYSGEGYRYASLFTVDGYEIIDENGNYHFPTDSFATDGAFAANECCFASAYFQVLYPEDENVTSYVFAPQGNLSSVTTLSKTYDQGTLNTVFKDYVNDNLAFYLPGSYADDELQSDDARVSELSVTGMIDGTAPWDGDDEDGNDSAPDNQIVRTFDTVSYDVHYIINAKNSENTYSRARMFIQAELDCTLQQAKFDLDSMAWLKCAKQVNCDGRVVLTGSYDIVPDEEGRIRIPGEGTLQFIVEVMALADGQTVQPTFYAWMEFNGSAYHAANTVIRDFGYVNTLSYELGWSPNTLVVDPSAGGVYQDVQKAVADPVTVSAAPKYNVQLRWPKDHDYDTFDFSTGSGDAARTQAELVKEIHGGTEITGRMMTFGVVLQLYNDSVNKGMKGIELPDPSKDITLTLGMWTRIQTEEDGEWTVATDPAAIPLLWEYEPASFISNNWKTGMLGRRMRLSNYGSLFIGSAGPLNSIPTDYNPDKMHSYCLNGGGWSGEQWRPEESDGCQYVTVTVSGFEVVNEDGYYNFPKCTSNYRGYALENSYISYPANVGCFSAGYFQVLYPAVEGVLYYNLFVADRLVSMTSLSGKIVSQDSSDQLGCEVYAAQARTDDDLKSQIYPGSGVGSIGKGVGVTPTAEILEKTIGHFSAGDGGTICSTGAGPFGGGPGIGVRGDDGWMPVGYTGALAARVSSSGDTPRLIRAADVFIRFDADGCQPMDIDGKYLDEDGAVVQQGQYSTTVQQYPYTSYFFVTQADTRAKPFRYKFFFASKADGKNWADSASDNAVDAEMCATGMQDADLRYYSSMAALKADLLPDGTERVCVGVLVEMRGGVGGDCGFGVPAEFTDDYNDVGRVFDVTNEVIAWTQGTSGTDKIERIGFSELTEEGCSFAELVTDDTENETEFSFLSGKRYRMESDYQRTVYDDNGNVSGATKNTVNSYHGFSYVIVGNYANITKTVTNGAVNGSDRYLNMDAGERQVNYRLSADIELDQSLGSDHTGTGTDRNVTVTIKDYLPSKKVSLDPNTTFTISCSDSASTPVEITLQDNAGSGTMTVNGETVDIQIEMRYNASTMCYEVTYTLSHVVASDIAGKYTIDYSANVGNPGGDEEVDEVKHNEQLTSVATIRCTGDDRAIKESFGNYTTTTFKIQKLSNSALVKTVLEKLVEINSQIGYRISYNNTSNTDYSSYRILDVLPYNGDAFHSSFSGTYRTGDITFNLAELKDSQIRLWYLTGERGALSVDAEATLVTLGDTATLTLEDGTSFTLTELAVNYTDGQESVTVTLPDDTIAVLIGGTLKAHATVSAEITILPQGNKDGDIYKNRATLATTGEVPVIAPTVSATVVRRFISGRVWADLDLNGIRADSEPYLSGVTVDLYRQNESGEYERISDGVQTNLRGEPIRTVTTGADGAYLFDALPQGTYQVVFGGQRLPNLILTKDRQGTDTARDSDAKPVYSESGSLQNGVIKGIVLHSTADMGSYLESQDYLDAGLCTAMLEVLKFSASDKETLAGAVFGLYTDSSCDVPASYFPTTDWVTGTASAAERTTNSSGLAYWYGLAPGTYYLKELQAPDGHLLNDTVVTLTVKSDGTFVVAGTDSYESPICAKLSISVSNGHGYELPKTGGSGSELYYCLGGMLILLVPMGYMLRKKRKKQ